MDLRTLDISDDKFVLNDRFILKERLGGGSFGQLYFALDKDTKKHVAIKLEMKTSSGQSTLLKEFNVLSELYGQPGFPHFHQYGKDKEKEINYITMELLGLNLEKLFRICQFQFTLKTVLMIVEQALCRLEVLHRKSYLHRDIKPENFCIGLDANSHVVYLIDFGLARSYMEKGKHISFRDNKGLVGTARYASLNTHLGIEQCRRDDLESLGFIIVYFLKGKLPWQNVKAETKKEKYQLIKESKERITIEELCKDLPREICEYMTYVRNLEFAEEPNYNYMKGLFRSLGVKRGYHLDGNYDWIQPLKEPTAITKKILNMDKTEQMRAKLVKQEKEGDQKRQEIVVEKKENLVKEEVENLKTIEVKKIEEKKLQENIKPPLTKKIDPSKNLSVAETKDFRVRIRTHGNTGIQPSYLQGPKKIYSMQMIGSSNEGQKPAKAVTQTTMLSLFKAKKFGEAPQKEFASVLLDKGVHTSVQKAGYESFYFPGRKNVRGRSVKESVLVEQKRNTSLNVEGESVVKKPPMNFRANANKTWTKFSREQQFASPKKSRLGLETSGVVEVRPVKSLKNRSNLRGRFKTEENLNDSSMREWNEENTVAQWMTQSRFYTHNKNTSISSLLKF